MHYGGWTWDMCTESTTLSFISEQITHHGVKKFARLCGTTKSNVLHLLFFVKEVDVSFHCACLRILF